MPDFARPAYGGRPWHDRAVERFTATKGSGLRAMVEARAKLMHVTGTLAGKWPHTLAIQPAGVTKAPDARDRVRIASTLRAFRRHLERETFGAPLEAFAALDTLDALEAWETGDAGLFLAIARDLGLAASGIGPRRYLSWGAYPGEGGRATRPGLWQDGAVTAADAGAVREDLAHSWMLGEAAHPFDGLTVPDEEMRDPAYSWCKAPRLGGRPAECGALARQAVDGHRLAQALAHEGGVRARVAARLLEMARTQIWLEAQVAGLDTAQVFMGDWTLPRDATGVGLCEAARGALGHWIRIEDGRIANYQIVAPTTWNFSPRDAGGVPGPLEQALVGAAAPEGCDAPLAVQHVVRSFDPCMVCTVH
jgi:hydrogenase large subunit